MENKVSIATRKGVRADFYIIGGQIHMAQIGTAKESAFTDGNKPVGQDDGVEQHLFAESIFGYHTDGVALRCPN